MILKTHLRGKVYEFKSLREVMGKANEEKSGDNLAGVSAESAEERVAAKAAKAQAAKEAAAKAKAAKEAAAKAAEAQKKED